MSQIEAGAGPLSQGKVASEPGGFSLARLSGILMVTWLMPTIFPGKRNLHITVTTVLLRKDDSATVDS